MERRAEYVVACLAAMKAGGAYLVLELAYPPPLLADVMSDAGPRIVLTQERYADRLPEGTETFCLDAGWDERLEDLPAVDDGPEVGQDNLAFISYSAGTTGKPKGIANPHRAPVRLLPVALRHQRLPAGRQGRVQRVLYLGDDAAAAAGGDDGRYSRRRHLRSERPHPVYRRVRDHGDPHHPFPPGDGAELERARPGREAIEVERRCGSTARS